MMIPFFDFRREYDKYKSEFDQAFSRVMNSGFLVLSDEVKKFEQEIADIHSMPSAVGLNSGTDAIYLALKALNVEIGDEVITVSNTAVPTVSAIRMAGAVPRFVDIDPKTLLMDLDHCENAITSRTKAIIAVHLFGNMLDVHRLKKICEKHKLFLIEDCAQSQFSKFDNVLAGESGDIGCFSFYPTKNLGAFGDGGLCISRNIQWLDKIRQMRMYGFKNEAIAQLDGINSRLDEMQAAFLRVKLNHVNESLSLKRSLAKNYHQALKNHPKIKIPEVNPKVFHTYHLFVIQVRERDRVQESLKKLGISTGVHYKYPIHKMPFLAEVFPEPPHLPHTDAACQELLSIPCFPGLHEEEQNRIISSLLEMV